MGWYNSSWSKRKKITLTGGSSGAQTNYQLKLTVAYDSDMQSDFSDLRFTKADGTTLIDCWMESHTASTSAVVWVEFPTTPANTVDQDYYMYYGNSGASSDWDIEDTFIFGDDFSDSSLDTTTRWTVQSGSTPSISSGIMTMNSPTQKLSSKTTCGNGYSSPIAIEMRNKHTNVRMMGLSKTSSGDFANHIMLDDYYNKFSVEHNNDAWRVGALTEGTWGTFKAIWTSSDVYGYEDSTELGHKIPTDGNGIPNCDMYVYFYIYSGDSSPSIEVDWVLVRKYAANPATYAFGSEQTPGNPMWYYNLLRRRNN